MCHQNLIYHHDTIQARSDSDFVVKLPSVHLYIIEHNSKSNRGIELKLYQKIPKVFFYVVVNFHVHQSLERTCDIGQKQVVWILLFTFYLTRILFLKECGACFGNFLVPQESLMSLNIISKRQWFINVPESFSYKDSLFILSTQGKKGLCYLKID
jgi:hypothetical protein